MMNLAPTSTTPRTHTQIKTTQPEVAEQPSAQKTDRFDIESQLHTAPKQLTLPSTSKVLNAIARAPQAPQRGLRTAQRRVGCEDCLPFLGGAAIAGCLMGGTVLLAFGAVGAGAPDGANINLKLLVPGAVMAGLGAIAVGYLGYQFCTYDGPTC